MLTLVPVVVAAVGGTSVIVATGTGALLSAAKVGATSEVERVGFDGWAAMGVASRIEGIEVDGWAAVGINVGSGDSCEQATNNSVTNMNNPLWKDDFIAFSGICYCWTDMCDEKSLVVSDNVITYFT